MPYINKIEVMGNLAKDPVLRYMPDGTPTTKITVAVAEKWTDKKTKELKEHVEWFPVLLYGRHAEVVCQYMKKGDCIQVYGKLRTRPYTDNSGIERNVTEVIANEMQIIHTTNRHTQSGNDVPQDGSLYNMM
ncbi:single-stranded DNA-binding protein [Neisseria dumasiana]|uniref:Single-stranded DNA-binding protein n=1 Tax=Neisseria dumasiana TaxID=1931275 RepID=A0ABX3WJA8_9NEIS|nr:single-stranded DNA-binding protein [Neisseria dumasiana]OSI26471.1 single-stranded DNA-binding protein [Neisseria dumasiana]UOO83852.1 single-stranded DNA-binding protein [Neisseria dumasiana]